MLKQSFEIWKYFSTLKTGHIFLLITITVFIIQCVYFILIFTEPKIDEHFTKKELQLHVRVKYHEFKSHLLKTGSKYVEYIKNDSKVTHGTESIRPRFCSGCFNTNFFLLFEPRKVCGVRPIKLVVFVTSIISQRTDREVLRQTWLSEARNQTAEVCYFFLLGRPVNQSDVRTIQDENDQWNDLVVYDFTDSYKNLSIKTILGFKYVIEHCPNAEFVMKTDIDVYVNLKPVLTLLMNKGTNKAQQKRSKPFSDLKLEKSRQTRINIEENETKIRSGEMFGLLWKDTIPQRKNMTKFEKWIVSFNEYPNSSYPDYFDGHAYILSMGIVKSVIKISRKIPFFKFEDVYIGLCLKELGYTLETTEGFLRLGQRVTTCSHKFEHVFTVHNVTIDRMVQIWNTTCPSKGVVELVNTRRKNQWIRLKFEDESKNAKLSQQRIEENRQTKFYYGRIGRNLINL